MRSLHTAASTHVHFPARVSAPCVALAGTADAWLSLCHSVSLTLLPSCLPSLGAALLSALLAGFFSPLRYHEGSDSCSAHLRRRSPRLPRHTFLSFRLQPREPPGHRLPPRQRDQRVSDFALESQARRSSPPNRVRYPTDQQFTSGCSPPRLAATQLPSATELWHTPTRTFTVLMWRPHGRTIPACAGMTQEQTRREFEAARSVWTQHSGTPWPFITARTGQAQTPPIYFPDRTGADSPLARQPRRWSSCRAHPNRRPRKSFRLLHPSR